MTEMADVISSLGVPVAMTLAFAYALYKIGTVCGTLLIDAWKAKDTAVAELSRRVDEINNGQRAALEQRLDRNTETLELVGQAMQVQIAALAKIKCLTDSDRDRINGVDADPKTLERIERREARKTK